jgi:hypothetical protein
VGLERGPLSPVRITEELVAAPGLENRDYGRGDPLRWPRNTLYQLKLALTSPTGCDRSVGIVRLRTKTTEFSFTHTDRYNKDGRVVFGNFWFRGRQISTTNILYFFYLSVNSDWKRVVAPPKDKYYSSVRPKLRLRIRLYVITK